NVYYVNSATLRFANSRGGFPDDGALTAVRACDSLKQGGVSMNRSTLWVAVASLGISLSSANAATVRWLHIEQNPEVAAFYADVAKRFEAAHPGTTVELQYLENESFKKKLTTLLQSPDRPNIIYSWAGGVLREQVKAGVIEDITAPINNGWRDRFNPAALNLY